MSIELPPQIPTTNTIDPGWNRAKADSLTLGELFLMAGSAGSNVIELCYTWLPKQEDTWYVRYTVDIG